MVNFFFSLSLSLDFDKYETYEQKLLQWKMLRKNADWTEERINHTSNAFKLFSDCQPPLWHCPDFLIDPDDITAREIVYEEVNKNDWFAFELELQWISICFSGQRQQIRLWLQCRIGRYRYIYLLYYHLKCGTEWWFILFLISGIFTKTKYFEEIPNQPKRKRFEFI